MARYKLLISCSVLAVFIIFITSLFFLNEREIRDLKSTPNDQLIQNITKLINNKDRAKIEKLVCYGEASTLSPEKIANKIIHFGETGRLNYQQSSENKNTYFFYPIDKSPNDFVDINRITIVRENPTSSACILIPYG